MPIFFTNEKTCSQFHKNRTLGGGGEAGLTLIWVPANTHTIITKDKLSKIADFLYFART